MCCSEGFYSCLVNEVTSLPLLNTKLITKISWHCAFFNSVLIVVKHLHFILYCKTYKES